MWALYHNPVLKISLLECDVMYSGRHLLFFGRISYLHLRDKKNILI
jgi:hypothetical protein